ncbi:hypothetical protein PFLUV_G00185740 [Perca fluviatilis]|uniref:C-type lectin domain-containing protein n=1 Tax=Perca fluviatilis TaxID=8168 RepID=A0A6A5DUI1_PERFL|nr:galactose-specific lectin nattectin-like [Perca fluviatilis]KAF1378067.1 hypothetical protein PFLUV_G00185740 [Perca fluviatilis]
MASVFPLALLLCLSNGLLTAYGQASCPTGWTQFGFRCFSFHLEAKSWIDAETFCQAAGGNLASIHSAEEYTFIRNHIHQATGADKPAWIGGFDAVHEGTWMWADGSKFNYQSFYAGEPNGGVAENCLVMNFNGQWNDVGCIYTASFVCSKNICV